MTGCPFAKWVPSPNHSSRHDEAVSLITIHITDGGPKASHVVESFCKSDEDHQKSAHFVVGRGEAELYQLVDLERAAWHDHGRNRVSVGIEHVARTPGELRQWHTLSTERRAKLLPSDASAADISAERDPGMLPTEEQLRTSAKLVAWLLKTLSLPLSAVVPHCSNPESSHRDCGRDVADGGIWPWAEYRRLVDEELAALSSVGTAGGTA